MKKLILIALVATVCGTSCATSKDAVYDVVDLPEVIYFDAVAVDDNAAATKTESMYVSVKVNP